MRQRDDTVGYQKHGGGHSIHVLFGLRAAT